MSYTDEEELPKWEKALKKEPKQTGRDRQINRNSNQ